MMAPAPRWSLTVFALLLAFGLQLLPVAPAEAGRVGLRTGVHPGFARLVFDWRSPVNYGTKLEAGYLEVSFARSADFDLKVLDKRLKRYVSGAQVSGDRRAVVFTLKGSYGLRHFTHGPKVVIDLLFKGSGTGDAREVGLAPGQQAPRPVPKVTVRGAEDPRLSRLVFDWPEPVSVKVTKRRGGVLLQFDKPAKLDMSRVRTGKLKQIAAVRDRTRDGGLTVEIDTRQGAKLRQWKDGLRVVVDVVRRMPPPEKAKPTPKPSPKAEMAAAPESEPERKAPAKPAKPQRQEKAEAEPQPQKGPIKLVPEGPWQAHRREPHVQLSLAEIMIEDEEPQDQASPLDALSALEPTAGDATQSEAEAKVNEPATPSEPAAESSEEAAATEKEEKASAKGDALNEGEPEKPQPEASEATDAVAVEDKAERTEEGAAAEEEADKEQAAEDLVASVDAADAPKPQGEAEEHEEGETAKQSGFEPDPAPLPGHLAPRESPIALRFNWPEPTAAATFRRGDHVWLVFDRRTEAGLAQRIAKVAPELSPVALESTTGTIVRLNVAHRLSPKLIPEGTAWVLDLRVRAAKLENPLTIVLDAKSIRPRAMVPLKEPGRLQSFIDPALGDMLYVAPVRLAGQGMLSRHDFPEFRILAAEQGIVLRPKTDSLAISIIGSTLVVTGPKGLLLSKSRHRETAQADPFLTTPGQRLFDLWAWREGGIRRFVKRRQELQKAQVKARGKELSLSRLRLARFYFAHGLAAEAAGVLAVLADEDARMARDPQVLVMRGASFVLNEQFAEAAKQLAAPVLSDEPEATLWRAALAALSRDWPYAATGFNEAEPLIADYVPLVRHRLRLLAAEAQIEVGDAAAAGLYLGKIRDDDPDEALLSDVSYLEGRRLLLEGDFYAARRNWQLVMVKADNRRAQARAKLALIDLGLEEGELTPAQAIEELERLQFVWRGDAFEFGLMERRAELSVEMGNFREGLLAFRRAASNLGDVGRAGKVTERMREIFRELFLGDLGKDLTAIKLLALYEEFRELTPPAEAGDEVVEGLAEKLAGVDLLDESIALLKRQVAYRMEGVEKARVGAEVTRLSLLNEDPLGALEGLEESHVTDELPVALERTRRFMKARALSLADRPEEALLALGPDDSRDAQRLRFEIRWRWRDWMGAAAVIEAMLPEELPVEVTPEAEQAELITALAVAYSLADDLGGLADLKWRFGPAMENSDQRETFEMLTGDLDRGMVTSIADELRGVAQIDSFLARYSERWQEASLAETPQ